MKCSDCASWLTARITRYSDGSHITTYEAPHGKGHCGVLGLETAADFGCLSFSQEHAGHAEITEKVGPPWKHWVMIPCPDCIGDNVPGCRRCAGTKNVRRYDDGFVGDERTRLHPNEKPQPLFCKNDQCKAPIEREWVACPRCGTRTEAPAQTVVIEGLGSADAPMSRAGTAGRAAAMSTAGGEGQQ